MFPFSEEEGKPFFLIPPDTFLAATRPALLPLRLRVGCGRWSLYSLGGRLRCVGELIFRLCWNELDTTATHMYVCFNFGCHQSIMVCSVAKRTNIFASGYRLRTTRTTDLERCGRWSAVRRLCVEHSCIYIALEDGAVLSWESSWALGIVMPLFIFQHVLCSFY